MQAGSRFLPMKIIGSWLRPEPERQNSMVSSQQRAAGDQQTSQPQIVLTASAPNAAALLESLLEIAWRAGSGQSNGVNPAGQPAYSFSVEGLIANQIEPHIALVCLDGDIDATLTFSYDQALAYLRERAEHWEVDPLSAFDCATATVEQLTAVYAAGRDPEKTWIEIVAIDSWFGAHGWRSLL
jgi:hypothetical protein